MSTLADLDAMLNDMVIPPGSSSANTIPEESAASVSKIESNTEPPRERPSSFSESKGVDSKSTSGELNPNYVKTEDLEGIILKRIPLAVADFDSEEIKKLMQYKVENTRSYSSRLSLEFEGTNIVVAPLGLASMVTPNIVTIMLPAGFSGAIASASPGNPSTEYSFSMKMRVTPVDLKEETVEELQGVFLNRVVTHDDITYVDFSVKNTRTFAVDVSINIVGDYKSRGFVEKRVVEAGETVTLGGVSNDGDISSSWQWKGLEPVDGDGNVVKPVDESKFDESELKGIFLGRVVFPGIDGGPGKIRFRGRNTLEKSVSIEVTVTGEIIGDSEITTIIPADSIHIMGEILVKPGKPMDIKWKWVAV